MAINLFSENPSPVGMSPRISFSHDLSQSDINFPVEQRLLRSISSTSDDFEFCIHQSFNQESTSAEELFSSGKILPTSLVKGKIFTPKSIPPSVPPPAPPHDHHGALNSTKNNSKNENDSNETTKCATGSDSNCQKQKSKPFWQFKRSSSLNCGNGYARSLCPLPPLLRSNSTGSSSSSKRSSSSKEGLNHKHHSPVKHSQFSSSNSHQKPPIKKNGYGPYHGSGTVRINPVLNVPPANMFGLGSIFSANNKETKNKKK